MEVNLVFVFLPGSMRESEEAGGHGPEYRCRDLTAYDHTPLDGELFLQVNRPYYVLRTVVLPYMRPTVMFPD
jgi:hypothetical protein